MGEIAKTTEFNLPPVAPQSESAALISMIERMASDPTVDIARLEKILELRERVEERNARIAFASAVANAKAEIRPVARNATGHNAKKYADFSAIAREVDPILSKHGLSYRFRSKQADKIAVACILSHCDGHSEETELTAPSDKTGNKNDIQAIGSTLTYLQRYTLVLSLGLASSVDDDGKAAGRRQDEDAWDMDPETVAYVRTLLTETNSSEDQFLLAAKTPSIEAMTEKQYKWAIDRLNQKKREQAK